MDHRKEMIVYSTKFTKQAITFSTTSGSPLADMHSLSTGHQESVKTIQFLREMYIPSRKTFYIENKLVFRLFYHKETTLKLVCFPT